MRVFDGIEYRGFDQKVVEDLARFSGVPVWNGLTDAHGGPDVAVDDVRAGERPLVVGDLDDGPGLLPQGQAHRPPL